MYCPQCSQQQPSDEMRYCSRCGFPLATVGILLSNEGTLPLQTSEAREVRSPSRSRVMIESVMLTFVCWTVALLATNGFDFGGPFEIVAKLAALVFSVVGLIGLLRFLYAFLFVTDYLKEPETAAAKVSVQLATPREASQRALPPQQGIPLTDWPRRQNTREMAAQPSVTENSTRLLDEDAGEHSGS